MPTTDSFALISQGIVRQVLWLLPLVLVLPALKILFVPRLRGRVGEARVGAVLDRIGTETLHDIILPDGRGGLTQIDHLVLTGASLLVVETKNYSGSIFGQERESQWTQKLGPQTNRFQNPLRQNYGHIQAVRTLVPGVPVLGRVVFTDDARFPQGMPAGVVSLSDLRRDVRPLMGDEAPSPHLRRAWATLRGQADQSPEARKAHLDALRARRGRDRRWQVAWGLLASSAFMATGLWLWPSPEPPFPPKHRGPVAAQAVAPAPRALTWSDKNPVASDVAREACQNAVAAVLIDNSAEHRNVRDRACAKQPNKPNADR